jgi:uncharacterized protein (TIGR03086 family)
MREPVLDAVFGGLDYADRIVAGVSARTRHQPTPCEGLDVEALTAHLVQKLLIFGCVGGGTTSDPDAVPVPDLEGVALIDAYRPAAARVPTTWSGNTLTRTFDLPQGRLLGADLCHFFLLEVLGHGWDLAVATGQPADAGEVLAEAGLGAAAAIGDDILRSPGLMGPAVPVAADSPPMDRFLAAIGRDRAAWVSGA